VNFSDDLEVPIEEDSSFL